MDKNDILTALSVSGVILTGILSFRAGVKCSVKITKMLQEDPDWEPTTLDICKECTPELIPPVLAAGGTITSILVGDHKHKEFKAEAVREIRDLNIQRQKDIQALENFMNKPENGVPRRRKVECNTTRRIPIGQGYCVFEDGKIADVVHDFIPRDVTTPKDIHNTGNGTDLFYEYLTKTWFRSSPFAVMVGIMTLKDQVAMCDCPTLVDYCAAFQIPCPSTFKDDVSGEVMKASELGWNDVYLVECSCKVNPGYMEFDSIQNLYRDKTTGLEFRLVCPELAPASVEYDYDYS